MREAMRQDVEREHARENFLQEALTSWSAYKEIDRHVTGAEVRAWLDTWGNQAGAEPPDCHE